MATFSLNSVNKNFSKYILFLAFIIIFPNTSLSEINISKINNKIYVLNIYGKRFFLNKENKIRSGDYLSTREKPATIILKDDTKICFSSSSSLKVLKNKDKINFEFKKGSILFYINKKSLDNYNLNFFSYNLYNLSDNIILSKKSNLEIINFKTSLDISYKHEIKKINLPPFTILELSNNGKVSRKLKILETNKFSKDFLEDCSIKLPKPNMNENKNLKLQYGCITRNVKLVCSNNYR